MSWPLSHDYNEAVQTPKLAFNDTDLKAGEVVVGAQGLPLPRSGNFADVYQIRGADGKDWAIKCFTRPVVGLADRYARVTDALERAKLPFVVGFNFLAEGIRVGGVWRPAVKMEWVEGLLLNQVARENAGRPAVLAALGQMWVRLCKRLREAKIAHADLQHGNVLLVPGTRPGTYGLKLIDYDGMYVPALANQPSGEVGHPAYQHPARAATRAYSPDLDRFPHLVVLTALKGLEVIGTGLWDRYDTGDNLLFTEEDFQNPAASKVMRELWQTGHPALQSLVGQLALACGKPIPQTPWIDDVAPEGVSRPLDNDTRVAAAAALGLTLPVVSALPPEPVAVPAAPLAGLDINVELVEDRKPTRTVEPKRPAYRSPSRQPEKSAQHLPLIVGGILLLVGSIATIVVLSGSGQKSVDSGQKPGENPPQDGGPRDKKDKEGITPKWKGSEPEKKEPEKKSNPGPVQGPPFELKPVGKLQTAERWATPLGTESPEIRVVPGTDSRLLAVTCPGIGSFCLDATTGTKLPGSENKILPALRGAAALDGGRFAAPQLRADAPIPIWNPRAQKWEVPLKPIAGMGTTSGQSFVSRDERYFAFGTSAGNDTPAPFKLKDVGADKVILELELRRGRAFFTADSSRVLVAEQSGKCRWFLLPSGKLDGEWEYQKQDARDQDIVAMSPGGEVVFVQGRLEGGQGLYHLLDARDGRVLRSFSGAYKSPSGNPISDDGRLAVFLAFGANRSSLIEVVETATGNTVARVTAPDGKQFSEAGLLPDGSAVVAVLGDRPVSMKSEQPQSIIRYDLVPEGSTPPGPIGGGPPVEWIADADIGRETARLHVNPEADLVLVGNPVAGYAAFEYRSGKPTTRFGKELGEFGIDDVFPMDRAQIATVTQKADEVQVWDARAGKLLSTVAIPEIPPGSGQAKALRAVLSPDGKYLAVGRAGVPVADNPEVPLRLFEVPTYRQVLATTWKGGTMQFTADSKRLLVAEWPGRVRWFDVASGREDGGWDFGPLTGRTRHLVFGISGDGTTVAYRGPTGSKSGEVSPAVVTGKTGEMIQRFSRHHVVSDVSLSANGRRAALLQEVTADSCTFEVVDVATGNALRTVRVATGRAVPAFAISPDGTSLILHDAMTNKLHRFNITGPKSP